MFRFVKVLAAVLTIGALIASAAPASGCNDSHADACVADCSCVCHAAETFGCHENASVTIAQNASRAGLVEPIHLGILLVAGIFRPPISI
jgi:hypothetical protein